MKLILMTAALAMGAPAMVNAQSMTKPVPSKGVPTAKPHHRMNQSKTTRSMPMSKKSSGQMDMNQDSSNMNDGSMDNSSMNNGSMNNGSMNNGTMNNGSMNNGSMDNSAMNNGSMDNSGQTMGGMQPSHPALSAQPQPGQSVVYQQAPSVEEAYPAPAAMSTYPLCKRGQTDGCRQPGRN